MRVYELANGDEIEIDDTGYFVYPVNVTVDLNDLINAACEGGYESVLDLISTRLTGSDLLTDFTYKVVGMVDGAIVLAVSGSVAIILESTGEGDWD